MGAVAGVVSWIHIATAIVAVGGLTFILMTLRPAATASLDSPTVGKLMGQVAMRFRWVVWTAIILFVVTGLWLMTQYRSITTFDQAVGTSYGRTLLVKSLLSLALFASALLISIPHRRLAWFRARALFFQQLNAALAFLIVLLAAFMVRAGGLF